MPTFSVSLPGVSGKREDKPQIWCIGGSTASTGHQKVNDS